MIEAVSPVQPGTGRTGPAGIPTGDLNQPEEAATGPQEVVEFTLAGRRYAIDIQRVREIIDMVPITPIPRTPRFITGVINLRGDITNIVNFNEQLRLPDRPVTAGQKIIVFAADAVRATNVGMVVDGVSSVVLVNASQVKPAVDAGRRGRSFVRSVICISGTGSDARSDGLVIWLDIEKLFADIQSRKITTVKS